MGIQNRVVKKKGRVYWEAHKTEILQRAGKYGQLPQDTVYPNSRERRYMLRHYEEFYVALFFLGIENQVLK